MRLLIAALLSAALLWSVPKAEAQNLNKQVASPVSIKHVAPIIAEQPKSEPQAPPTQPVVEQVQTIAPTPAPIAEPVPIPPVPSSHEGLMAAAGIAPSDYAAVDYIVSHESTWNTNAVNASSGSCGLVQELPCGKSGCTFGDGVCQLQWATQYAISRYGSWWGAHSFWSSHRWW